MTAFQETYNNNASEETEIDLKELFVALLAKWYWIAIAAVVLAGVAFSYFKFFVEPTYESTTQIYIMGESSSASGSLTYNDLQLGTQLGKDYPVLVKSRSVVEKVIGDMGLDMTYGQFLDRISVSIVSDSRILSIKYTDTDPVMAQQVANKLREVVAVRIKEVMGVPDVKVVDDANLPVNPVGPKTLRNTVIGGMLGAILAAGIVVVLFLLNDRIKTPEDIERYLSLSVLGSIPVTEEERSKKRKDKKEKK